MEILRQQTEYEIVRRYYDLSESAHSQYDVSNALSFFISVLCWTIQRIRPSRDLFKRYESRQRDIAPAHQLFFEFMQEPAVESPWNFCIREGEAQSPSGRIRSLPYESIQADQVLVALRNVLAHGDARSIWPVNNKKKRLVGFQFDTGIGDQKYGKENRCRADSLSWTVILLRKDMTELTRLLAGRFCNHLEKFPRGPNESEDGIIVLDEQEANLRLPKTG